MKKFLRNTLTVFALGSALFVGGCKGGEKAYKGDYHYSTEYGVYGVKVSVEVKNGIIKDVDIIDSKYRDVTAVWDSDHKEDLLESFEGKSVKEVLSYTVAKETNGEPTYVSANGIYISATASSTGSLILAVQNALSKI